MTSSVRGVVAAWFGFAATAAADGADPSLEPIAPPTLAKPGNPPDEAKEGPVHSEAEKEPAPAPPAPAREPLHLAIALKSGMLVLSGRPGEVALAGTDSLQQAAQGRLGVFDHRGATVPVAIEVSYRLPWLQRAFGVVFEAGFHPIWGKGRREMPEDPDFGTLEFRYETHAFPLALGVDYRLPFLDWLPEGMRGPLAPLKLAPFAAFVAAPTRTQAFYGAGELADAPQFGWALGFYAGLDASFRLGPGDLVAVLRYANARTDLSFGEVYPTQPWNRSLGDVQGTQLLAGYRYTF